MKNKNVNIPIFIVAIILMLTVLFIGYKSIKMGTFYIKTDGNPTDTINSFYSSLISGNYAESCTYVEGCSNISFDRIFENKESELLSEALVMSYHFNICDDLMVEGLNASQTVVFYYLDTDKIIENAKLKMDDILNEKIEELPKAELYDDEGNYLTELINEVYYEAIVESITEYEKTPGEYEKCCEIVVKLSYIDERWIIIYDENLFMGLGGGR